jgi:hypothetical protein
MVGAKAPNERAILVFILHDLFSPTFAGKCFALAVLIPGNVLLVS